MISGTGPAGWAGMGSYHCRGALYCAEPGTGNTDPVLSARRRLHFTLSVRIVKRTASFQAWSHRKPEPAFPDFYCRVCQLSDLVQPDENLSGLTARRIVVHDAGFRCPCGNAVSRRAASAWLHLGHAAYSEWNHYCQRLAVVYH